MLRRKRLHATDETAPSAPYSKRAKLEQEIADPLTGELRRRQLMRQLDSRLVNGRAYGATDLRNPGEPATDDLTVGGADSGEIAAHRRVVADEIKAIEERVAHLSERLSVTPSTVITEEVQAAQRERGLLRELVADLRADREPVVTFRASKRRVTERDRKVIASRTKHLRERKLAEADDLAKKGDWRESVRARVDAYRARLVVEFGDGLRERLSGY